MRFNECLLKYGLHDTTINKLEWIDSNLIFYFNEGIYLLDENNKETIKSKKCRVIIHFINQNNDKIEEHVIVTKLKKNKSAELKYQSFFEEVEKNGFEVLLDYYSDFAKSILIKGYLSKYQVELVITDIKEIKVLFITN